MEALVVLALMSHGHRFYSMQIAFSFVGHQLTKEVFIMFYTTFNRVDGNRWQFQLYADCFQFFWAVNEGSLYHVLHNLQPHRWKLLAHVEDYEHTEIKCDYFNSVNRAA